VTRPGLYVHALRAARPRQLRARALRPLWRRSFPAAPPGAFRPLDVPLWRTAAFAVEGPPAGESRLARFRAQYGEEVLGAARRGDTAAAAGALAAWIAANPPRPGDAWHPYPLSTRIGSWVAALSLEPALATGAAVESLGRQLAHLERNVEDDVLGNHVIRNARGLVLGGLALGRSAAVERGLALLQREVPEQVLPDGGHFERSPAYHLVVLRDLLEVRAAADAAWLDEPIGRMTAFAAALARPDGAPALFNDGALDLAPALELPPAPDGLAVFPDTGYAVLRAGGVWLAFDCGPPGPDHLPAHAHADALSFQLRVEGRPLVVDPGSYTYEPGPERDAFRGTRAHSTIALGGRDQFELWGAFRAGPLPRPRLVSTEPLVGEVRLGDVLFRRRLRLEPDALVVEDELVGSGTVEVCSSLPLGTPVAAGHAGPLAVSVGRGWLAERMEERAPIDVLRAEGRLRLPARLGWRIGLRSGP
jgi:hypothetical protein